MNKNTFATDDHRKIYAQNGILLSSTTFTLNGYTYHTDVYGRIIHAYGYVHLRAGNRKRIRANMQDIAHGYAAPNDDRGHIIADLLDGSNLLGNFFPQNSRINRGIYQRRERSIAELVRAGIEVQYQVCLVYADTVSYRPDLIITVAYYDDLADVVVFANPSIIAKNTAQTGLIPIAFMIYFQQYISIWQDKEAEAEFIWDFLANQKRSTGRKLPLCGMSTTQK